MDRRSATSHDVRADPGASQGAASTKMEATPPASIARWPREILLRAPAIASILDGLTSRPHRRACGRMLTIGSPGLQAPGLKHLDGRVIARRVTPADRLGARARVPLQEAAWPSTMRWRTPRLSCRQT